jgi:Mrp family chromosome partitioning ATPase
MSTNQAFIKAYRHDPPRTAAPAPAAPAQPARVPQPAAAEPIASLWQSTVEIAAANYSWPTDSYLARSPAESPPAPTPAATPIIGKQPLSKFAPPPIVEAATAAEPAFVPETTISAFRWPPVCRALWERYADHYDHIAELMLARSKREPGRGTIVGITSLHAGDGATSTLLCLAIALAARKRPVIVVDANFRAPRLAGLLGVQPSTSWQDVLEQGLSVAEAVVHAEKDGIDLLPLDVRAPAAREPNGARLAAGVQTAITAGVLRYAYDMVLVDLGAVLAPRSFTTMSHLIRNMRIETAVAVSDPKHAEQDDFTVTGELLDEAGCELLGLIENRSASLS